MFTGNKKTIALVSGAAVIGLAAVGIVVTQQTSSVSTPAIQGAIGQREVYRDSSATGAAVDGTAAKEFEKLYQIGQFKALANEPEFKELAKNPAFIQVVTSDDFQKLVKDKNFRNMVASGEFDRLRMPSMELEGKKQNSVEMEARQRSLELEGKKQNSFDLEGKKQNSVAFEARQRSLELEAKQRSLELEGKKQNSFATEAKALPAMELQRLASSEVFQNMIALKSFRSVIADARFLESMDLMIRQRQ